MALEIRPIRLPDDADGPDADELVQYADLLRRLDHEALGTTDLTRRPREVLRDLRPDRFTERTATGAFDGGRLVGLVEAQWELDDAETTAYVEMLGVAPERRREGIGSLLLAAAEESARAAGRPTVVLSAEHRIDAADAAGGRLRAPQGDGEIPADAPSARFALARGFALGQVYRVSAMDAGGRGDEFRRRLAAEFERSTDDYRLVAWQDRAPDELVDSLAIAHERMSTDPPAGAIAWGLEHWNAERIRDGERRSIDVGRVRLTVAAVAPDGEVAGFTELSLLPDSQAVEQWDTIVLGPHRGHRLGMRMKLANLVALAEAEPSRNRIVTWNADENEHMLAINTDLGFRPFAFESVWQRP
ncbi:GNAT family N-acetyltransferase [Agromyces sp. M3QZ16-3]|uniref:GNAT family N-acetyltransferase n=1 Tax=Agromyces sp. M3QZ16-3 TaxID=3447585 RepID=UPI003F68CB01